MGNKVYHLNDLRTIYIFARKQMLHLDINFKLHYPLLRLTLRKRPLILRTLPPEWIGCIHRTRILFCPISPVFIPLPKMANM